MAVEEAFQLACSCAYRLACEVVRQGERLGFLSFVDGEPDSQTCGERVLECPGCGERLGLVMLFSAGPGGQASDSRVVSQAGEIRPAAPWPP